LLILMLVSTAAVLFAQTTADTGSIVGTVRDPSGALVVGARIAITDVRTGRVIELTTNSSGAFNSGGLIPGDYKTRITARGFKPVEVASTVLVGNIATVNADLEIGNGNEVIEEKGSALRVNTEQPAVQGVLNEQQIENLPVNGRNFLDLAQLEPGVQIQDAANFGKDGSFLYLLRRPISAVPPESRRTTLTFPTKYLARLQRTSPPAASGSSN
jgi:Carboxypeptidase regulatory-like domain